jgi:hypothetical protein
MSDTDRRKLSSKAAGYDREKERRGEVGKREEGR